MHDQECYELGSTNRLIVFIVITATEDLCDCHRLAVTIVSILIVMMSLHSCHICCHEAPPDDNDTSLSGGSGPHHPVCYP